MSDLLDYYDEDTKDDWDHDALREAANYAELIDAGIIPASGCVQLGAKIGHEKAWMVKTALGNMDGNSNE